MRSSASRFFFAGWAFLLCSKNIFKLSELLICKNISLHLAEGISLRYNFVLMKKCANVCMGK
jgi:hypothetical protein